MDWFRKSSKVEGKNELESLGIRFEPIQFHPHRNEYELRIQLTGCPRNLITLTYDNPSGELKLKGKKQKTEFVYQFPIPTDCLATRIYGRFRGDVLHIIMPRLVSEWPASSDPETVEKLSQIDDELAAPPLPRAATPAPWNMITIRIGSRKEEEDQEPLSDQNKAKQGDVEPEKSIVIYQKNESKLGQEIAINVKIATTSNDKEESEEEKPNAGGKETLGLIAKVKATMKEGNLLIGAAAILALVRLGVSLRLEMSTRRDKAKNDFLAPHPRFPFHSPFLPPPPPPPPLPLSPPPPPS